MNSQGKSFCTCGVYVGLFHWTERKVDTGRSRKENLLQRLKLESLVAHLLFWNLGRVCRRTRTNKRDHLTWLMHFTGYREIESCFISNESHSLQHDKRVHHNLLWLLFFFSSVNVHRDDLFVRGREWRGSLLSTHIISATQPSQWAVSAFTCSCPSGSSTSWKAKIRKEKRTSHPFIYIQSKKTSNVSS